MPRAAGPGDEEPLAFLLTRVYIEMENAAQEMGLKLRSHSHANKKGRNFIAYINAHDCRESKDLKSLTRLQ